LQDFVLHLQGITDSLTFLAKALRKLPRALAWRRKIFHKWKLSGTRLRRGPGSSKIIWRFSPKKNQFSLPKSFADCKGFGLMGGPRNSFPGGGSRGAEPLKNQSFMFLFRYSP
jgi:hypothetical protein